MYNINYIIQNFRKKCKRIDSFSIAIFNYFAVRAALVTIPSPFLVSVSFVKAYNCPLVGLTCIGRIRKVDASPPSEISGAETTLKDVVPVNPPFAAGAGRVGSPVMAEYA